MPDRDGVTWIVLRPDPKDVRFYLGGEPLEGSGFEDEEPETDPLVIGETESD